MWLSYDWLHFTYIYIVFVNFLGYMILIRIRLILRRNRESVRKYPWYPPPSSSSTIWRDPSSSLQAIRGGGGNTRLRDLEHKCSHTLSMNNQLHPFSFLSSLFKGTVYDVFSVTFLRLQANLSPVTGYPFSGYRLIFLRLQVNLSPVTG